MRLDDDQRRTSDGVLVYQTSDPDFAQRASDAMTAAGIENWLAGEGTRNLGAAGRRLIASQISILIRRREDYAVANQLLIKMGAIREEQFPKLRPWVICAIVAGLVAIAIAVST